jgi:putative FmdB family regulatory protein
MGDLIDFGNLRSYHAHNNLENRSKTMPIFEFHCIDCGNLFEKLFVNASDEANLACPECGCKTVERVVSRTTHVMGVGPGGKEPKLTSKSCGPSSQCMTLDLPGPSK